jgi:transposase
MSREIRADYRQKLMFPPCLEDWLPEDHPARFVREFVDRLPLKEMGWQVRESAAGRPSYAADLLLKVWVYGYLERIRSTRQLEKACRQNVALIWLTGMNYPDHNTLWRFWRDNRQAMKGIFRQTVEVAAGLGLVEMVLHAVDGTKITARGSTHKAWGRKRFEKLLKHLDREIEEAMEAVEQGERSASGEYRLPAELTDQVELRRRIQEKLAQLEEQQREHLNPVEPEARMMKNHEGTRLGYNAQVVVDAKAGIIVASEVSTDANDKFQLRPMLEKVEEGLGRVADQTVADAGYCSGEQLAAAEKAAYPVLVNLQCGDRSQERPGEYPASGFVYDAERDCLTCPRGGVLVYECTQCASLKRYEVRRYRCRDYRNCPVRWECSKEKRGRAVKLSPYLPAVQRQQNKQKDPVKSRLLKLRMGIVEPAFAWVKHVLDFRRWTMGGLDKVRAQWSFLCALANLMKLYPLWREGKLRLA